MTVNKEIDLIATLKFLWRMRNSLLISAIIGVVAGLAYFFRAPKTYVIRFPVTVAEKKIAFSDDPDILNSTFNGRMATISSLSNAISVFGTNYQMFLPKLDQNFSNKSSFIYRYIQDKTQLLKLSSFRGDEDYQLEIRLPFYLKEEQLVSKSLNIVNELITQNNLAQQNNLNAIYSHKITSLAQKTQEVMKAFRAKLAADEKFRVDNINNIVNLERKLRTKDGHAFNYPIVSATPGYGGVLFSHLQKIASSGAELNEKERSQFEKIWTETWVDITNERILYNAENQIESYFNEERANFIKALNQEALSLPHFKIDDEGLVILNNKISDNNLDRVIYLKSTLASIIVASFCAFIAFLVIKFRSEKELSIK